MPLFRSFTRSRLAPLPSRALLPSRAGRLSAQRCSARTSVARALLGGEGGARAVVARAVVASFLVASFLVASVLVASVLVGSASWTSASPFGVLASGAPQTAVERARAALRAAVDADAPAYPEHPAWTHARALAESAVRADATSIDALRLLAEVHTRSGFDVHAWDAWMDLLSRGYAPTPRERAWIVEIGHRLAWWAYERGDPARSLEFHQQVLQVVPTDVHALRWSIRLLEEADRPHLAVPFARRWLDLAPDDPAARWTMTTLNRAIRMGSSAARWFERGVAAYGRGDVDAAREAFTRASDLAPLDAEAWAWRGRVAFERGDWGRALAAYAVAADRDPDQPSYRWFRDRAREAWAASSTIVDPPVGDPDVDDPSD